MNGKIIVAEITSIYHTVQQTQSRSSIDSNFFRVRWKFPAFQPGAFRVLGCTSCVGLYAVVAMMNKQNRCFLSVSFPLEKFSFCINVIWPFLVFFVLWILCTLLRLGGWPAGRKCILTFQNIAVLQLIGSSGATCWCSFFSIFCITRTRDCSSINFDQKREYTSADSHM